jgi:hypothetical protein
MQIVDALLLVELLDSELNRIARHACQALGGCVTTMRSGFDDDST